jgi:hypothetical protein
MINIRIKELCIKLVIDYCCIKMHGQPNIKVSCAISSLRRLTQDPIQYTVLEIYKQKKCTLRSASQICYRLQIKVDCVT